MRILSNHLIYASSIFALAGDGRSTVNIVCQSGMARGTDIRLSKGLRSSENYPLFGHGAAHAFSVPTLLPAKIPLESRVKSPLSDQLEQVVQPIFPLTAGRIGRRG